MVDLAPRRGPKQRTVKTINKWIFGVVLGGLISVVVVGQEAASNAYRRDVRVTPLLKTQADYAGLLIAYPTGGAPEVTAGWWRFRRRAKRVGTNTRCRVSPLFWKASCSSISTMV